MLTERNNFNIIVIYNPRKINGIFFKIGCSIPYSAMNEEKTSTHIKIEDVVCQNIQTNNFARLQLEAQTVKHKVEPWAKHRLLNGK